MKIIGWTLVGFNTLFLATVVATAVQAQQLPPQTSVDPVCEMEVNKSESYDWRYQGVKYYFDSYNCREAFKANPQHFLDKKCVPITRTVDPVCGSIVDITESYDYKYKGRVYHFHTLSCKEAFRMNPEKFIKACQAQQDTLR